MNMEVWQSFILLTFIFLCKNQTTWALFLFQLKISCMALNDMFELFHLLREKRPEKNMEATMKKKCLSLAILVLVVCNSMNPSRAISMEPNSSTSIIADDNELEFLMDSHSSRILQSGGSVTGNTGNAGQLAVDCGRGQSYDSCLPNPNRPVVPQNCGVYNRACNR